MSNDDRVLHLLKTRGPQPAAALGAALGITASAVRQHLTGLVASELVRFEDRRGTPGRPKRFWLLSERGHARFPDTHSQLTSELIRSARVVFGEDGLGRLIAERERASLEAYRAALSGARTTGERVRRLARLRSEEGYMAEHRRDGRSWILVENHCPICAAATECQGFCRSELEIFQRVLGDEVVVEREEHVLHGGRRCAYRIRRR